LNVWPYRASVDNKLFRITTLAQYCLVKALKFHLANLRSNPAGVSIRIIDARIRQDVRPKLPPYTRNYQFTYGHVRAFVTSEL